MQKIIYVHVMKSAGTTMRSAFKRIYGKRLLYDRYYKPEMYKKRVDDKKHLVVLENQKYPRNYENYDCIIGHFKWNKYEKLNWPYVTFLRDPVERIISAYYYLRGNYKRLGYDLNIVDFSKLISNQATYMVGDLNRYEFVGITEKFSDSFSIMCEHFGLKKITRIEDKRISPLKKGKVSKKIRTKIKNNNLKDVKLYEKARRRFESFNIKS